MPITWTLSWFEQKVKAVFKYVRSVRINTLGMSVTTFQSEVIITGRVVVIELCEITPNTWVAWELTPKKQRSLVSANWNSADMALSELKQLLLSNAPRITAPSSGSSKSNSRMSQLDLRWFVQLAKSIFTDVTNEREIVLVNMIGFQADVLINGHTVTIDLQRQNDGSWNAWVPIKFMTNVIVANTNKPRTALEKLKGLIEGRLSKSVSAVKPIVPPRTATKFEVMSLTRDQCCDIVAQVFNVQYVEQVAGRKTAFRITVVMFERTIIELDTDTDGRWIAHEPVSNKIAHDEQGSESPLQVLRDLKKKLMQ